MKNVTYIDYKTTIWQRIRVSNPIPEDKMEELQSFLGSDPTPNDAFEFLEEIGCEPCNEVLYDTDEPMSVEDNSGADTVEIYNEDDEMIWDNANQITI